MHMIHLDSVLLVSLYLLLWLELLVMMNSGIIQDQFTFSLRVLMEVGNKVQRSDPLMELLQISMVYQQQLYLKVR